MKKELILFAGLTISTIGIRQQYEKKCDSLMQKLFSSEGPGGVALVVQDGQMLYRKAFGKANMELDVDMVPENVFRIGSNTKQFT